jgi:preprotein translocase subunit SecA
VDGEVEVRNQRGQLDAASTARAQREQAAAAAALDQGQNPGQQAAPQQRGAFGQPTGGNAPAPMNRAERRAQEKRGR